MQWECVVFKDGQKIDPIPDKCLWQGGFSIAHARGSIFQYIE